VVSKGSVISVFWFLTAVKLEALLLSSSSVSVQSLSIFWQLQTPNTQKLQKMKVHFIFKLL